MKVLITGFGPFKDFDSNPSAVLVEKFKMDGLIIRKEIFDVNQEAIEQKYPSVLDEFQPDFILNIGLSAKANGLNLETFAINSLKNELKFSKIGEQFGYKTKIDTSQLTDYLCKKGIPSCRSDYAGSYFCNFIYFLSLEWCQQNGGDALFLHIPFTSKLACEISLEKRILFSSLPEKVMSDGINEIIEYVKKNRFSS